MLCVAGSSLKMVQFFMQELWMMHDVVVVWPGSCNNVLCVTPSMSQSHYVAVTGWPNAGNILCPAMLRYVALKRYDHLARLANKEAIIAAVREYKGKNLILRFAVDRSSKI